MKVVCCWRDTVRPPPYRKRSAPPQTMSPGPRRMPPGQRLGRAAARPVADAADHVPERRHARPLLRGQREQQRAEPAGRGEPCGVGLHVPQQAVQRRGGGGGTGEGGRPQRAIAARWGWDPWLVRTSPCSPRGRHAGVTLPPSGEWDGFLFPYFGRGWRCCHKAPVVVLSKLASPPCPPTGFSQAGGMDP